MWEISQRVFLGDRDDARDAALLSRHRVTHVVNCAEEVPCHFPSGLRYLHLAMRDPDERFVSLLPRAFDFIDTGPDRGGVLVHCSAGVSRSAAVVLAWLCCRQNLDMHAAAKLLSNHVLTNPDPMFLRDLGRHLGEQLDGAALKRLEQTLLGRTE